MYLHLQYKNIGNYEPGFSGREKKGGKWTACRHLQRACPEYRLVIPDTMDGVGASCYAGAVATGCALGDKLVSPTVNATIAWVSLA